MIDVSPLQAAMVAALRAAPATYAIYDAVPEGASKPYVVVGEVTAVPDEELAAASADASFQVHAWSAHPGKKEAHEMLEFVRARLDHETIGTAWACTEDFAEVMEDPKSTASSRIYHGVARYRLRLG